MESSVLLSQEEGGEHNLLVEGDYLANVGELDLGIDLRELGDLLADDVLLNGDAEVPVVFVGALLDSVEQREFLGDVEQVELNKDKLPQILHLLRG